MIVLGNYDQTAPASDGQTPIPDGTYMVRVVKVEDRNSKKGNPMTVLSVLFFNESDWPADTFKPNATRQVYLNIPAADAKDDDMKKQGFLKAVQVFMGLDLQAARSALRTGVDTAQFKDRTGYLRMETGPRSEKDPETQVEKTVNRQESRIISQTAYSEAHGTTGQSSEASAAAAAAFGANTATNTTTSTAAKSLSADLIAVLATNPAMLTAAMTSLTTKVPDTAVITFLATSGNAPLIGSYSAQVAA